jgi:hypothetical protein
MKLIKSFNQFINEGKKPKGAPNFHHSDAPEAEGRFRDLSIKDLAAWLIKTREKDVKRISGSLTQQIVFNRKSDPEYAEKMEKTRKEVYKQLGREDLLESDYINENLLKDYNDLEIGSVYRISDTNSDGEDITADYKYDGVKNSSPHFTLIRHFLKPDVLKGYKKYGKDWKTGETMWTGAAAINRDIKQGRMKKIDNEDAKKEWYKFQKSIK